LLGLSPGRARCQLAGVKIIPIDGQAGDSTELAEVSLPYVCSSPPHGNSSLGTLCNQVTQQLPIAPTKPDAHSVARLGVFVQSVWTGPAVQMDHLSDWDGSTIRQLTSRRSASRLKVMRPDPSALEAV
jgi:hypothetical protein